MEPIAINPYFDSAIFRDGVFFYAPYIPLMMTPPLEIPGIPFGYFRMPKEIQLNFDEELGE